MMSKFKRPDHIFGVSIQIISPPLKHQAALCGYKTHGCSTDHRAETVITNFCFGVIAHFTKRIVDGVFTYLLIGIVITMKMIS